VWPRQPPIGLRLVGGDETSAGGSWQLTLPPQSEFGSGSLGLSEHFRARWNNALSAPVLARGPLTPFVRSSAIRRGRGFVRIYVDTHATGQKMAGKFVELQRKSTVTGAWVLASRARLKRVTASARAESRIGSTSR